ncbi:MAG: ATP-binding protein, partial [Acidimicrobiales bacterium]
DGVYLVSPEGKTVAHTGDLSPEIVEDPAVATVLDLATAGRSGGVAVVGDSVFLIAGAPHVTSDGSVDAVILLVREIDAELMDRLHRQYGPEIVLTDGDVWVSSFSVESLRELMSHKWAQGAGRQGQQKSANERIGGITYRLVSQPVTLDRNAAVTLAVLQPMDLTQRVIWQTTGPIVLLGLLLVAVNFALSYYLIHSVFRPLESLQQVAQTMAGGDLSQPDRIRGTVEVESLFGTLDRMRIQLKNLVESQQQWNEQLETQVQERTAELDQLHRQRNRLMVKIVSEQEEQQRRVARDLHDDTSQVLVNLSVYLGGLAQSAEEDETEQQLQQAKQMATDALEGLHRIVQDLRPRLLDDMGLQAAVRWHMRERLEGNGTVVDLQVEGHEMPLPPHVETSVYRIVQEAVNNIVRHTDATKAWLHIRWKPSELRVEIGDNGRGFVREEILTDYASGRGLGLLGMQERTELMGGVFTVQSEPGVGTQVTVRVPISSRSYTDDTDDTD